MAKAPKKQKVFEMKWYGDGIIDALEEEMEDALFAAGKVLLEAALAKAPRRTGALAETGYIKTKNRSTYKYRRYHRKEAPVDSVNEAAVGFSSPNAHLQEFGTVNMAANPFFRPAFDEKRKEIVATMTNHLGDALKAARVKTRKASGGSAKYG